MQNALVLVTGGARSGKSRFAQDMAQTLGGRVVFIATAEARDGEMAQRIEAHRASRPPSWETVESPLGLAAAIRSCRGRAEVVLVDCLGVFVSNLLCAKTGAMSTDDDPVLPDGLAGAIEAEAAQAIAAAREIPAAAILVTNEAGAGLVPPYAAGRLFRDVLGRVNQAAAAAADRVYLVQCGLAVELKSLSLTPAEACAGLRGADRAAGGGGEGA